MLFTQVLGSISIKKKLKIKKAKAFRVTGKSLISMKMMKIKNNNYYTFTGYFFQHDDFIE